MTQHIGGIATNQISREIERGPAPLLRIGSVLRLTGLGRSTIYRLMAENKFPLPVRLTKRVVAWRSIDVERWSEGSPTATH